jgi:hypothetical protein
LPGIQAETALSPSLESTFVIPQSKLAPDSVGQDAENKSPHHIRPALALVKKSDNTAMTTERTCESRATQCMGFSLDAKALGYKRVQME